MKNILENQYLNLAVRLVVGFLFVYAGIGKAADPNMFAKEIGNYQMIPYSLLNIMSLSMPWIEIISGILLMAGVRIKANSVIIGAMLIVFIAAVGSAMARGLNINCGCFSGKNVVVGWPKIIENTSTLIGCVYLYFYPVQKFTVENLGMKEVKVNPL